MAKGKTADRDITVKNDDGQTVVLVHKGQPVPDDVDDRKKVVKAAVTRTATAGEIDKARGL